MSDLKTLYTTDRNEWRKWLESHFEEEKEIWLIYPKKASGKPRILYNDAVEDFKSVFLILSKKPKQEN